MTAPPPHRSFERSAALAARAERVIPNGVFGHRRTFAFASGVMRTIPDDYPHFVERAEGCRVHDVDGHEYIDYLCGYGPMIAGYANPAIEAAAAMERARGDCYDFPTDTSVLLAERLVGLHAGTAWAAFSLNGTDAITMAVVIARAATGRDALVVATGAFHGNHTWASGGPGWSAADHHQTRSVPWGDAEALAAALRAEPVAAVVLCPYEQLVGADNTMPPAGYWDAVRAACDEVGTMLVIDDIRSGFRVDPAGTCAHFGIRPDLLVLSKAMANGYPIAAVLGTEPLRDAASTVFVSGTFWGYGPALAAALATLDQLAAPGAHERLTGLGRRLTDGLTKLAADAGHDLVVTGAPALPHVRFAHDPTYDLACAFATELAARGTLIHPTHNWFLSLAHTEDDVDETLAQAADALAALARNAPDDAHR